LLVAALSVGFRQQIYGWNSKNGAAIEADLDFFPYFKPIVAIGMGFSHRSFTAMAAIVNKNAALIVLNYQSHQKFRVSEKF